MFTNSHPLETWFPFKNAHPLIPVKIVKNKDFVALAATGSVATMIYNSMNVLWPSMVESLFTDDVITVGWYSVRKSRSLGMSMANSV